MGKKNNTSDVIKSTMVAAGIYENRFDFQIEDTAYTIDQLEAMKKELKKEGFIIRETKDKAVGEKVVANPLIDKITNLQKLLIQQLSSLKLNLLKEKEDKPIGGVGDDVANFLRGVKRR